MRVGGEIEKERERAVYHILFMHHQLVDSLGVVSIFWLLLIMLLKTSMYKFFSFLSGVLLQIELLGHILTQLFII